ncbi:hypothetical protein CRE_00685 [Caenorhabditis remanei]|uniref:Uncharacterized protein n=1 Tax=Caenorhabditis remanei TaxID=31234 RepID=E3LDT4_CAERE|nr:hypothetical protein CRE_00685 [Caenorhabditis remanei]
MDIDDRKAEELLQLVYFLLTKNTTGPYLYKADLKGLAAKTNKSVIDIRLWFIAKRDSDPKRKEYRYKTVSDEINNQVTRCIELAIKSHETAQLKDTKQTTIREDSNGINNQVSPEERTCEPKPKRSRLEKPEEIKLNAEKTLKFLYYNLLWSEKGPYLYDACIKKLGKRIGRTEEEIKNWFTEKLDSQKNSLVQIPDPIDGVSKDKVLSKIVKEATLDEKSIQNPKPFQLPDIMYYQETARDKSNWAKFNKNDTGKVTVLDYIHTELRKVHKDPCISLGVIGILSEKINMSAPSIMEWFEAKEKGISSGIPVENIRMSEALFEQIHSIYPKPFPFNENGSEVISENVAALKPSNNDAGSLKPTSKIQKVASEEGTSEPEPKRPCL